MSFIKGNLTDSLELDNTNSASTLDLLISNSQVRQHPLLFNCVFAVNTLFGLGP